MYELIYRSQANPGISAANIAKILETSRAFNAKNDITGCLLFHNNEFIQILEGDQTILHSLYDSIKKDPLNTNVLLLARAEKETRIFPTWFMAYYKFNEEESLTIDKILFASNFITLSEWIDKPTYASRLFWYISKQLLEHTPLSLI
ncbi:MAG: BLUF domain-containing protein [Flavobacterium sp.]